MHRCFASLMIVLIVVLAGACESTAPGGGSGGEDDVFAVDEDARTTGIVTAEAGGTITAPTGDSLFVPPGAVSEDVEITLTPLSLPSGNPDLDVLGGVKLEPDGLVFAAPATLTLRLALSMDPGTLLLGGDAPGELTAFYEAGYLVVDSSGSFAVGQIHGFSGKCTMRNCHSGTREALLTAWQGVPGRSAEELMAATGMTQKQIESCQFHPPELQFMMGSFFEPCGTFPTGVEFDVDARLRVKAKLDEGLMVVFLFAEETAPLTGTPGVDQLGNVIHSAVGVLKDGKVIIRNQLNVPKPAHVAGMSAQEANRVVDLPLDEIDIEGIGLRDKRNSEVGRELEGKPLANREKVPRAWSNVAVFCEKPRDGPVCTKEALPNAGCGGNDIVCIGTVAKCTDGDGDGADDASGAGCCPADMCNYYGACVQIACPADVGRNYNCACCCTAGMGDAGSCADTDAVFNVRDACNASRLCSCASMPPTKQTTCGG